MIAARIPLLAAALVLLPVAAADNKPAAQLSSRRMSYDTRAAVIRSLNAERVYVRLSLPRGPKGLTLRPNGQLNPTGGELAGVVARYGAATRPGDRVTITNVEFKDNLILFEINGGSRKKKSWWQHLSVGGIGGEVPLDQTPPEPVNERGSSLVVQFDRFVPEMSVDQLKTLLAPVFDFNASSGPQAYLKTLPAKVQQAVKDHQVLVGMNRDLAVMAKGRPPRKIRERDQGEEYEEWIYGDPPQDVEFIRFVGDEVVRVEIMKVTGEKVVRTDREMTLEGVVPQRAAVEPAGGSEAKDPLRPPTLRRPGEPDPGTGSVTGRRDPRTVPGAPEPGPTTAPPTPPPPPNLPTENPQSFLLPAPAGS